MLLEVSDRIKNIYCFWFAFSFILNGYSSGISGVSLGSLVFIVFTVYSLLLLSKGINVANVEIAPLLIVYSYIIITIVAILTLNADQYETSAMIMGISKLILWSLMITFTAYIFLDYDSLLKWLTRISVILTIYIIIQSVAFYLFSIYLPNILNFGFLKPYAEGYAAYDVLYSSEILRPASFLSESSFYGNYILCTLVIYIDKHKHELYGKKKMIVAFFILGIIASTSTSAIVLLFSVLIIYIKVFTAKYKHIVYLSVIILITLMSINSINYDLLSNIDGLGGFGKSLGYALAKFQYASTSSRLGGSYSYLELIDGVNKIVGVGVGNEVKYFSKFLLLPYIYLNSVTLILVQVGIIGLVIFMIFILMLFKKSYQRRDVASFTLLFIYFIKCFASGISFSTYGILFLTIIIYRLNYLQIDC